MNSEKHNPDLITWLAILVQVIGVIICSFLLFGFFGLPIIMQNKESAIIILPLSLALGTIVWAIILFKTPMFEWWFINIKPNYSAVLGSQLKRDVIPTTTQERMEMFKRASLREIGSGIRGKLPWEMVVQVINMQSEILIGTDKESLVTYTKAPENIRLEIRWQVKLTPLPGYLTNLVRHTEDNIIAFFRGECDQFIMTWVKSKSEDEVFGKIDDHYLKLKKDFEILFGGEKKAVKEETDHGVWTNQPQIVSIRRDPKYEEAANAARNAGMVKDAVDKLAGDRTSNYDPNILLLAALGISGGAKDLNPIILAGLGNASPEDAARLIESIRLAKSGGGKK